MPSLLAPLVPAVLRHLEAYAEIAGEDARDAAAAVARRLLALLIAAAASFIALLMFCAWLLALTWDGPWRTWTAAGLAFAFATAAAALAIPVLRRRTKPDEMLFPRVRQELNRDRELIDRALNGGDHAAE
jgi:membrane protein implicated in regulation of membrane protease activity